MNWIHITSLVLSLLVVILIKDSHGALELFAQKSIVNHADAIKLCKDQKLSLIFINNKDTVKLVNDLAAKYKFQSYWIDAEDNKTEGKFTKKDGTVLKYKNFGLNEPNGGRKDNCVVGVVIWKGAWNDVICSAKKNVICSKP